MTTTFDRVFVTGAAGFVGAALVHELIERGCVVHAVVHPRTDTSRLDAVTASIAMHRVDLLDVDALGAALRAAKPSVVFHAAARGGHPSSSPELTAAWRDTVLGTVALAESLRGIGVRRLVHLGSSLEYAPSTRPLRELDPIRPSTARGMTKAAAAILLRRRAEQIGLPVTEVRPFSVYGPHEPAGRLIPTVMRALCSGGTMYTTAETSRRDFVHVDDVVDACLFLAACPAAAGAACNVGTGVETSTHEVVRLSQTITGRELEVHDGAFPARSADTPHWVADMSFTSGQLGWSPAIDLAEGLRRTFAASPAGSTLVAVARRP